MHVHNGGIDHVWVCLGLDMSWYSFWTEPARVLIRSSTMKLHLPCYREKWAESRHKCYLYTKTKVARRYVYWAICYQRHHSHWSRWEFSVHNICIAKTLPGYTVFHLVICMTLQVNLVSSTGHTWHGNISRKQLQSRHSEVFTCHHRVTNSNVATSKMIGHHENWTILIWHSRITTSWLNCLQTKLLFLVGIFATSSDIEKATDEILKMRHFDHLHVMSLIGVCLAPSEQGHSSVGPSIVMPFMAKGSLLDYLRKEADNLFAATEDQVKDT